MAVTAAALFMSSGHGNKQMKTVHCTEIPDIHPVRAEDKEAVEEIVVEILKRQDAGAHGTNTETVVQEKPRDKPIPAEPMEGTENSTSKTEGASMMALTT